MVILSMTATFGCLENARLELKEGLNLLDFPNESGKSTWCALIRAMFYGLESRKGGAFTERNRYLPWSGAAMRGEMDLLWQGKALTLRRFPKGSDPFGGFQCVYTGTEEPVAGLTADNVGETLLGMTKEVFQRTCLIAQGGMTVDASGDLERRVAALAAAGEEDVSYSDAERRLRDWRNARQANRAVGSLPRLRARREEAAAQCRRLREARARGAEAQAALERLAGEEAQVREDLARHAKAEEARRLSGWRESYERAAQRLAQTEEALADARQTAEEAQARLGQAPALPRAALAAPAVAPAVGLGLILAGALLPMLWLVIPGFLIPLGCLAVFFRRKGRQQADLAAYQARFDTLQEARRAAAQAQEAYIAAQAGWEAVSAQGEPPAPPRVGELPRHSRAEDEALLRRVQSGIAENRDRLSRSLGEEAALGGSAPPEERLAALDEAIGREEGELAALDLALEALGAANAALRSRFSPALNAEAGAILSRLTGGKYDRLTFTREFEALAQTELGPKSARLLSRGTADQTYLALRLALCRLAPGQEDPPPLILDDALVSFDDARLRLALAELSGLARERQLLLFTCQSREGRVLRAPCNLPAEPV